VKIELANASEVEKQLSYRLLGPVGTDTESVQAAGSDLQLVFGTNGSNGQVGVDLLGPGQLTAGNWERGSNIAWVGVSNNYFTGILFPLSAGDSASRHVEKAFAEAYPDSKNIEDLARSTHSMPLSDLGEDAVRALKEKAWKNLRVGLKSVNLVLKPGASVTHEYGLFLGPRARTELDLYGTLEFQGVNYYGWYSLLVKLFMGLLGILKTLSFGSWGVAIILLTFLVKLVLHPINKRSTAGMQRFQKKLQKLKPEMDLLKERFANDRLRQNQETQKLWKKHGVNPGQSMAGCLVIFLQLPVWFGVYATLQYAFGLRQAGFLYISDLTRPDHLFAFGANLPIIGSHFNLLPILYVILTVVNQQLQPKPEDPQMQMQFRMMSIMMVVIGFIFYTSPAGFMLYIMTQAALSIAESKIIKAELARDETADAGDASAPTKAMYPMRSKKTDGEDSRDRPRRG
jgi:YidC/Oxa1 family membrane protein insertase